MSTVALWQTVTVALACSSSRAIGLPTVLLRPITTACLPLIGTPVLSISFMQPEGVHGRKPGRPAIRSPALCTEYPSTSLAVEMRSITFCGSMCFGSGIWTRMPWMVGSALSASRRAISSASDSVASYFSSTECTPASAQALTLFFT